MADTKTVLKKEEKRRVLRCMLRDVKPILPFLILATVISVLSLVCSLTAPTVVGTVLDTVYEVWEKGVTLDLNGLLTTCAILLALYFGAGLCSTVKMVIMNNVVSRHFTCAIRITLSEKIKRMPVKFVDDTPNGEVLSRMMNDVSRMGNTIHNFLDMTIVGVIQIIAIIVLVFCINSVLALIVITIMPLSMIVAAVLVAKCEKHFHNSHKFYGKMEHVDEEDYGGFEAVKAFNLEDRQNELQGKIVDKLTDSNFRGYYISMCVQPIISFMNSLAYVVICVVGGALAIAGTISVGDVVAVVLYAKLFATPLESIANGLSMLQQSLTAAGRVYQMLDRPEMDTTDRVAPEETVGEVEFRNVDFSYVEDKPLIRDFNLSVKKGQKIAIVGPTGAGKTTIVNLLMRFYDVQSGDILIDGNSIYDYSRESVRKKFAMVLQDTWLFGGTIAENIAYGKPDATREEIASAAKKAHVDHFVMTLENGYDTAIREDSNNVSAGQKQLLTIARAFLADSPMLILDEATSNVDTRMEMLIHNAMDTLMKGRTSFVIAHRLSTIVDSDVIIVIRDGQIVEKGTHTELLDANGFYTEIYNSQYASLN